MFQLRCFPLPSLFPSLLSFLFFKIKNLKTKNNDIWHKFLKSPFIILHKIKV